MGKDQEENMKSASPFVIVDNCKEAIEYYQNIFGGEVKILNEHAGKLMHAELHLGSSLIHFADSMGKVFSKGENVKIILQFEYEDEIKKAYQALSSEGQVVVELQETFFGALHADLTDKNNIEWVLNYFRS